MEAAARGVDPATIKFDDMPEPNMAEIWEAAARELFDTIRRGVARIDLDPRYVVDVCNALAATVCNDDRNGVTFEVPLNGESPVTIRGSASGVNVEALICPLARER